jgi:hypothetical protein
VQAKNFLQVGKIGKIYGELEHVPLGERLTRILLARGLAVLVLRQATDVVGELDSVGTMKTAGI